MVAKTYSDKLRDPRWQKKRLEIMKRDKFTCKLCGDNKTTLNVHHLKYTTNNPYDESKENLITLCTDCHQIIEDHKKSNCNKIDKVFKVYNSNNGTLFIVKYSTADHIFVFTRINESVHAIGITNDDIKKLIKFLGK